MTEQPAPKKMTKAAAVVLWVWSAIFIFCLTLLLLIVL